MNALRNKVQLIGRLGQEPEIVTFNDGNKMAKFSLATDDSYKDKEGQKVERAYWHNIVVKGGLVTVVESYVKKGQEIARRKTNQPHVGDRRRREAIYYRGVV